MAAQGIWTIMTIEGIWTSWNLAEPMVVDYYRGYLEQLVFSPAYDILWLLSISGLTGFGPVYDG
jgi:hypothetical protein